MTDKPQDELPEFIETAAQLEQVVQRMSAIERLTNPTLEEDELFDRMMMLLLDYDAKLHPRQAWLL